MTNNKLTNERIQQLACGQSGLNLRIATYEESMEMARELQEYRKASNEPVYWQFKSVNGDWLGVGKSGAEQAIMEGCEVRPLYAAPPLQAVTVHDEPLTQIKPVADLYGITSPTGSETSFTFYAVEARNFIDGGWSVQEYVELERYQQACAGNSPVIPDGYALVPIEPTKEMYDAGDRQLTTKQVWDAMIAAAPPQQ